MAKVITALEVQGTSGYKLVVEELSEPGKDAFDSTLKFVVVGPAGKRHATVPMDWSGGEELMDWLKARISPDA